jgi:hypothetical protein
MLAHPTSNSRAQTHEARRSAKATHSGRARARKPYLLLRVCLRSKLRREPGRWSRVFPQLHRKSQLRFAGSGPHSPPRWRTRGRRCDLSLPLQEKSVSGDLSGRPTSPDHGDRVRQMLPGWPIHTLPSSRHTDRGALAQLSNNSKKSGWGQRFLPHPRIFPYFIS